MSDTIYARVGPDLKEATDQYAKGHGMSLASGVSDLSSRGLEAAENESSIRVLGLGEDQARLQAENRDLREQLAHKLGAERAAAKIDMPTHRVGAVDWPQTDHLAMSGDLTSRQIDSPMSSKPQSLYATRPCRCALWLPRCVVDGRPRPSGPSRLRYSFLSEKASQSRPVEWCNSD